MDNKFYKNYAGVNSQTEPYFDFNRDSYKSESNFDFSHYEYMKGRNQEYDELDLLSECSTPVNYVPGKYLQLCDISPDLDDVVQLGPISRGLSQTEIDMTSLFPGNMRQEFPESNRYIQNTWKSPSHSHTSSRLTVLLAACMVVALTALGGLSMFV